MANFPSRIGKAMGKGLRGFSLSFLDGSFFFSWIACSSCGQFGNDYQEHACSRADKAMECPVADNMRATAVSSGNQPNFYCGPDEEFTGAYDPGTKLMSRGPSANSRGRTDVKGCCFWGRGALLTRGTCMLGKLNHYLGAQAARDGRTALFPEIDFCGSPEDICQNVEAHPTLVWDVAFFEWVERCVQS